MKEKNQVLFNKKGTLSREVFNMKGLNEKSDSTLLLISLLSNIGGSLYMICNNIPEISLTLGIKNGINVLILTECFLIKKDIEKRRRAIRRLSVLLMELGIKDNIYSLSPEVINDGKENENNIDMDYVNIREFIEDGNYKCELKYVDEDPIDITKTVENITGGVKKLKQNK